MEDVINKVPGETEKTLVDLYIFLATDLAIFALYNAAAVQTIFLLTLWLVAQLKIFLKNRQNSQRYAS
jgi:hypothetical protein